MTDCLGVMDQRCCRVAHEKATCRNVTSLTDLKGAVLERHYYSPYGQVAVVAETYFGDYDGDGFVDSGDADDLCSNGEGCACEFTSSVSGDCRVFDFDCDGDLDVSDESTLSALYSGLSADMQNRRIPSTTFSPTGNPFTHQGLVLDVEIASYQNRARRYAPKLKRFMQRDPMGLVAGINLYAYALGSPIRRTDPRGLSPDLDALCFSHGQPPDGATGSTVCDGEGGFVNCVNHCCTVASGGCHSGPPMLPDCIHGYPPPSAPPPGEPGPPFDPCPLPPPPPPPGCEASAAFCQGLSNSCVCKGEQKHTTQLQQYHPNACQNRGPGEPPVVSDDDGSPGTYSYCYRHMSEYNALVTAQNCIGNHGGGAACAQAQIEALQPVINEHYSFLLLYCQGFQPGAPYPPSP